MLTFMGNSISTQYVNFQVAKPLYLADSSIIEPDAAHPWSNLNMWQVIIRWISIRMNGIPSLSHIEG